MKFFIFFFFLFSISYAQENDKKVDSLLILISKEKNDTIKILEYNRINSIVNKTDPKKGNLYLQKTLPILKKLDWGLGYSATYNAIGTNYGNMAEETKALEYYLKSLEYSDNKYSRKELSNENYLRLSGVRFVSLNNVTSIYIRQKNLEKAVYYNQLAFEICEENTIKENKFTNTFLEFKSVSFNLLSDIFLLKKDTLNAVNSIKKSLAVIKQLNKPNREASILNSLGSLEVNNSKKLDYFLKAKEIWDNNKFISIDYATNLNSLAQTYFEIYNEDVDIEFFDKSKNELIQKAEFYSRKALETADTLDATMEIMKAYKNYSNVKKVQNDYESAYNYNVLYHKLNDSIFSQESKNILAALEIENEIKVKDKEIEVKQIKLQAKETQNWYLTIGLVLVSLLGGLLLYQNKLRKAKNEELEEANRIKTRFFNILNHDLRMPVGDLINFLHLKKDNPDLMDIQTEERLDKETIDAAENLLVTMEDLLLWSKGQMENFETQTKRIDINLLFNDIYTFFSGNKEIKIVFNNIENLCVYTDENYLKTIARNLTSNAIKALSNTQDAKIEWKAYRENSTIIISIEDNGSGGTMEQFKALYNDKEVVGIKNGLGLHLVRDMAKAIKCKVEVNTKLDKGTIIKLIFDIKSE